MKFELDRINRRIVLNMEDAIILTNEPTGSTKDFEDFCNNLNLSIMVTNANIHPKPDSKIITPKSNFINKSKYN